MKESGAIEQRISQAERESQELEVRLGHIGADLNAHQQQVAALEKQTGESRERMLEKNRLREQLQAAVREREQAIERSRTAVLRLLGEGCTREQGAGNDAGGNRCFGHGCRLLGTMCG